MVVLRANGCILGTSKFNVDCYLVEHVEHFELEVLVFDSLRLRGQTITLELLEIPLPGASHPCGKKMQFHEHYGRLMSGKEKLRHGLRP